MRMLACYNRQQQEGEVTEEVDTETKQEPSENVVVTEVKTADAEKAVLEESRVGETPEKVAEEVTMVEIVEETSDPRENDEGLKIEK